MSYASVVVPAFPAMRLPRAAIRRRVDAVLGVAGFAVQCAAVAAVLWVVLAAPGVVTDRSSTGAAVHVVRR